MAGGITLKPLNGKRQPQQVYPANGRGYYIGNPAMENATGITGKNRMTGGNKSETPLWKTPATAGVHGEWLGVITLETPENKTPQTSRV